VDAPPAAQARARERRAPKPERVEYRCQRVHSPPEPSSSVGNRSACGARASLPRVAAIAFDRCAFAQSDVAQVAQERRPIGSGRTDGTPGRADGDGSNERATFGAVEAIASAAVIGNAYRCVTRGTQTRPSRQEPIMSLRAQCTSYSVTKGVLCNLIAGAALLMTSGCAVEGAPDDDEEIMTATSALAGHAGRERPDHRGAHGGVEAVANGGSAHAGNGAWGGHAGGAHGGNAGNAGNAGGWTYGGSRTK
jgi:hypothetical protein